tara:strand:+ start:3519 stop:3830 length:312 start_codon:yes stop_codon:yes gene_type:complete
MQKNHTLQVIADELIGTTNSFDGDKDLILEALDMDFQDRENSELKEFLQAAECIVETPLPEGEIFEYYESFMNGSPTAWAAWIRNTLGDFWGSVADYVAEHGY